MTAGINLQLTGRVVLVTGGVRGVGAGISAVFAEQGATVITCARREVEGLPYEFHACDVRDDAAVKAMIDAIVAKHGRLDIVVNNAGGSPFALAADASAKFSTKIIELNLIAPLLVSTHANAVMQQQDAGGVIVNISSVSAHRPTPGTGAYGAAKAGVDSLTTTLAVEWSPKVRVNSIIVGMVETEQSELFYGDAESVAAAPVAASWRDLGAVEHVFTHFSLTLRVFAAEGANAGDFVWTPREGLGALPSVFLKAARAAERLL